MYTLNQLVMFINVAEKGSFSKAAEGSSVTANAVAKQMKILEEEFGVKLLEKSFKGQSLTSAGEKLYKNAKVLIDMCSDAVAEVKLADKNDENVIRIGTSVLTPFDVIDDFFVKIRKTHPELVFELVPFTNEANEEGIVVPYPGSTFDIYASSYDEIMIEGRNLNALEVKKAKLYAIMSVNHRLADKEILEHDDLEGETLMVATRGRQGYLDDFCDYISKVHDVNFKQIFAYDAETYSDCANSNDIMLGMGNLSKVHPLLVRVPIRWDKDCAYGIIYSKNPTPKVSRFIEMVKDILND